MELVVAELGAAVGMAVGVNAVDAFRLKLLGCLFDGPGDAVDTANCRDNPYFVADACRAVGTLVAEKFVGLVRRQFPAVGFFRLVGVMEQVAELALHVVRVDPGPSGNVFLGRADGKAVFDDVLPLGDGDDGEFMACRNIV